LENAIYIIEEEGAESIFVGNSDYGRLIPISSYPQLRKTPVVKLKNSDKNPEFVFPY
jgi:hypothetical protein